MTELYCGILKKYHSEAECVMKIDPAYCIESAFVPHFYFDFYVYQYATSMSVRDARKAAAPIRVAPISPAQLEWWHLVTAVSSAHRRYSCLLEQFALIECIAP
jgi:hypothetical protein